mmetsp:Transcript_1858/g.4759  ORF Transcript_1858/g.4759 Transcript_1858/m.4759 type:complete len:292 (-) Transcript_1858:478-1353(-)
MGHPTPGCVAPAKGSSSRGKSRAFLGAPALGGAMIMSRAFCSSEGSFTAAETRLRAWCKSGKDRTSRMKARPCVFLSRPGPTCLPLTCLKWSQSSFTKSSVPTHLSAKSSSSSSSPSSPPSPSAPPTPSAPPLPFFLFLPSGPSPASPLWPFLPFLPLGPPPFNISSFSKSANCLKASSSRCCSAASSPFLSFSSRWSFARSSLSLAFSRSLDESFIFRRSRSAVTAFSCRRSAPSSSSSLLSPPPVPPPLRPFFFFLSGLSGPPSYLDRCSGSLGSPGRCFMGRPCASNC